MQRDDVRNHQTQQNQRHSDDVEAEEAVEGCIAHHKVTTNQQGQIGTNERNRSEQVHDHLRTPVAHLTPWQQVAHERLCHQAQENRAAENPHQFARLAVAAVHETTEHVHVHHDKKRRRARGVHVTDQPAPRHITHDVFD